MIFLIPLVKLAVNNMPAIKDAAGNLLRTKDKTKVIKEDMDAAWKRAQFFFAGNDSIKYTVQALIQTPACSKYISPENVLGLVLGLAHHESQFGTLLYASKANMPKGAEGLTSTARGWAQSRRSMRTEMIKYAETMIPKQVRTGISQIVSLKHPDWTPGNSNPLKDSTEWLEVAGVLLDAIHFVNQYWIYKDGIWQHKPGPKASGKGAKYVSEHYQDYLRNKEAGFMLLLAFFHTAGANADNASLNYNSKLGKYALSSFFFANKIKEAKALKESPPQAGDVWLDAMHRKVWGVNTIKDDNPPLVSTLPSDFTQNIRNTAAAVKTVAPVAAAAFRVDPLTAPMMTILDYGTKLKNWIVGTKTAEKKSSPKMPKVKIISPFNQLRKRKDGSTYRHQGIDIRARTPQRVYSPSDGTVMNTSKYPSVGGKANWGQNLVIVTPSKEYWRFAHLSSLAVPLYSLVKKGQFIATTGSSGGVDPHLHVEYYPNQTMFEAGKGSNPAPLIQNIFNPTIQNHDHS